MKRRDKMDMRLMRGTVSGHWFNPMTGEIRDPFVRCNQLSYSCADVLARLMAGQSEYAPRYMGFIYGSQLSPTLYPISRTQSWTSLDAELSAVGVANMQISPFTQTPGIAVDPVPYVDYDGNSALCTSATCSGADGDYAFPTGGAVYADVLEDGDYLYHAMLLTRFEQRGVVTYWPVARLSLAQEGVYAVKPAGFELSLTWQVSFF